jgi:hypothetical protein
VISHRTSSVLKHALLAVGLVVAAVPACAALQASPDSASKRRREFPLNCRGGERLAFDTLGSVADTATSVHLSLRFIASRQAAGWNGEGLEPSTCAWVDRPLNSAEPRQVRFAPAVGDSTPQLTLRDTRFYWSFLAYNTDSGHFRGVGYRHWKADDAVVARASEESGFRMDSVHGRPAPAAQANPRGWTFEARHLPLFLVLGSVLIGGIIAGIPLQTLLGFWSGWRRLAGLYPSRPIHGGRRFRCGLILRITWYRSGVRLTADDSHLHFSVWALLRLGHPLFSVPWADVTVSRDGWPWLPFKGRPVMRLTLARDRGIRILVPVSVGEGIIAASNGRLQLTEPRIAADVTR